MKKILVFLMVVLAVALFAADPNVLVDATIGEPDTLDPHLAYDTSSGEVLYQVYENLIQYDGSSLNKFLPRLSTEVPTVDNGLIKDGGKTYIFPIRKGVKFHNGNDLTPEDVEYSFERGLLYNPAGGPVWMLWYSIFGVWSVEDLVKEVSGKDYDELFDENGNPLPEAEEVFKKVYDEVDKAIEVEGDNVVFHLKRPYGPFLNVIAQSAHWGAILDKEWCIEQGLWDGQPTTWWKWHNQRKEDSPLYQTAMGTGPYKFVEWDRAQQKVILEANENYWREPAKIKKVIIWGIDEYSTRKAMLEKGDADIAYIPIQYLDQVRGNPDIEIIEGLPTLSITALGFNWTIREDSKYIGSGKLDGNGIPVDFFNDVHARKAIAHVINYDALIGEVLKGFAKRVPTALPEGLLGFDPSLPLYDFNLFKARQELMKAWNGEAWKKGFKFSVAYNLGNEARQRTAEMVKMYLEMLNPKIKIDVVGLQWPTFLDATKRGELPIFILGWLADFPDPDNFIFTYYDSKGDYGPRQGKKFREFVSTPHPDLGGRSLDELIEQAAAETDATKRAELYAKVQKFVIDYAISVPLYQPVGVRVQRKWLKGWYPNAMRPGDDYYSYWFEGKE
ncbi:peptide ABC transporter substrate-binding protein [Thermosipho sp. 1063]|uniref:ABC transporter substrate-binding protein n=1 Tax=unclassified Thermosipho (in: thermotogales) TaxID=2676525 RepID=UPI0009492D47|nr:MULTISPECIES: ABC transporter substrate-binding protein [unclassified Thermosipho (in: thermotogales)]ANQ53077.1 peptide ABC transporter substrate-binding protein [Thermosipho sp. 1070]APT71526.1 peptide ABC transporter substrate-binding protein [Thermosipho sp. 1063]